ncbi:MAG: anthranilate synthase component I family protein [Bacteroidales bacterium]|nr:anthranilate synthase component I family protein [Bacteroidales bacterium]
MREELHITVDNKDTFKKKLLIYGNIYSRFAFLDSNNFDLNNSEHTYYEYNFLAGLGSIKEIIGKESSGFKDLIKLKAETKDWLFGFFTYDLKNELENLESKNIDELIFPAIHFFSPEIVILSKDSTVTFLYYENQYSEKEIFSIIHKIESIDLKVTDQETSPVQLEQRFHKDEYTKTVKKLKNHIQRGDIYEINFCHEFYSKTTIDPINIYSKLKEISPTPFSCYYKLDDKYLISASPERFLKKIKNKIISQPIKGTIKRGLNEKEDFYLKDKLFNDPKERAENIMIVDLVRNDLSRTAKKGSVKVEELYGIYSFSQVHQMISTVVSEVENNTDIIEIIKNAFPVGSMTGAPKIRAMQLIEEYEKTKRDLYSGSVGFITPDNDFDFNVVIRSILYNQKKNYVSFTVGGAITSLADPEKEYEECMVKAEAMMRVLI